MKTLTEVVDLANQHRASLQKETATIGDGMAVAAHLFMGFCADAERAGHGSRDQIALNMIVLAIQEWRAGNPTFVQHH